MHQLLYKWLAKRGIKNPTELDDTPNPDNSPTEKQEFEKYRAMLSVEPVTLESLKSFIKAQIGIIEGKWTDLNIPQERKAELIPYHTTYKILLHAIDSPVADREKAEKQLEQLIG